MNAFVFPLTRVLNSTLVDITALGRDALRFWLHHHGHRHALSPPLVLMCWV